MDRQRSFEVLDLESDELKQDEVSAKENTNSFSDLVPQDESPSTELLESDYSENSLSTSSDFVKLDVDEEQTAVAQFTTSHDLDKSQSSGLSDETNTSILYHQLQVQFSKTLPANIPNRIHFYVHDFLLGSILFSLLLGHMLYTEQCNNKLVIEAKRIEEYETERTQLLTNVSLLSTEIARKNAAYQYLENKHKRLKNVTRQLQLDLSIVTTELRDRKSAYSKLKSDYKVMKRKMNSLTTELRRLKIALMDIKRSSLFFPGVRLIKDILCRILSVCPDLDG
ncbi:unnamed protein product [Trichobilharzia szidati]|nr:unnamed protein product [Trichobilharzia szidati]CAH8847294.1 unnamed protein product [Trichobilharzia szidati]